jgi:hypothetical protein
MTTYDPSAGWSDTDPGIRLPEPAELPHVAFGDLPNQVLPFAWAEEFLRIIYRDHPGVFRAVLPQLYKLPPEPPKPRRAPRAPRGGGQ